MCLFLLLEICQLNKEQDIVWIRLSWKLYVRDTLYGVISIFLTFQKQTQTLIIMRTNSTKSLFAVKDCNAFLKSDYMLKEQFFPRACTKLYKASPCSLHLKNYSWKVILHIFLLFFSEREKYKWAVKLVLFWTLSLLFHRWVHQTKFHKKQMLLWD